MEIVLLIIVVALSGIALVDKVKVYRSKLKYYLIIIWEDSDIITLNGPYESKSAAHNHRVNLMNEDLDNIKMWTIKITTYEKAIKLQEKLESSKKRS